MPSSSSSGGTSTYRALPPPKQQAKFPNRRRLAKQQPSIPRLRKDNTLTQMDFVSTPKQVIPISSDDEEYQEPRPKKRRRKSKFDEREAGQSTYTQFRREWSGKSAKNLGLDEDGFQIWEDSEPEFVAENIEDRQAQERKNMFWPQARDSDVEDVAVEPEIPETSQLEAPAPHLIDKNIDREVQGDLARFHTPRKVRFTEVPSSQTPPSTKLSTPSPVRKVEVQRSPLKERSTNVQSTAFKSRSPESQDVSMKMLERVRLAARKVPLNDIRPRDLAQAEMNAKHDEELGHDVPVQPPAQKLRRVTTIQDSQPEDTLSSTTAAAQDKPDLVPALKRVTTVQDSQSEGSGISTTDAVQAIAKPERTLKRVTTIQDSQYDDVDLLTVDDAFEYQTSYHSEDDDEEEYHEDDEFQATYDPAMSALDRDAARFKWTQTQQLLSNVDEQHEDSETDDEDLDRGCAPTNGALVIPSSHDPSQELGEAFDPPPEPPSLLLEEERSHPPAKGPLQNFELQRPDSRDASAYESGDLIRRGEPEIEVPSSSPPLRPSQLHQSQVSTVMPTQISQRPPLSRMSNTLRSQRDLDTMRSVVTISSSPQKSYPSFPDTLSSSPLPLPPLTSPEKTRSVESYSKDKGKGVQSDMHFKRLVDYSLPPPPPMGSSGRQTPVSSST